MLKAEFKYGIITGIGISLWILLEFLLGFHTNNIDMGEYSTYFVVLVPLLTLYLGIKEKRDKWNKGQISFNSGIKTGLMISLIGTVIIATFLIIYFNYLNPDYAEWGLAYHKKKMILRGKSSAEIAVEMEKMKSTLGFLNQFLYGTIGAVGTGFIISAALSLFMKRTPGEKISI